METTSIILLVVSASISFGLGRFVVHLRNKKRQSEKEQADKRAAQAHRNLPPRARVKKQGQTQTPITR